MRSILRLSLVIVLSTFGTTPVYPQTGGKIPLIGVLDRLRPTSAEANRKRDYDALLLGLRELGYVDGKNIRVEPRFSRGADQWSKAAEELVRLNSAVLVTVGTGAVAYAMKATKTIPILMQNGGNPVNRGFVKSFTQPGGNVTGFSSFF